MTDENIEQALDEQPEPESPKDGDEGDQTPDEPQAPEEADGGDQVAKLRHEAAGYRRKLREAESERDAVRLRLDAIESREVERQAGERLADAGDIWRAGVTIEDLRDDDGALDAERVRDAVKRVAADHPHWREPSPDYDGGVRESAVEPEPDFAKALREAAGG